MDSAIGERLKRLRQRHGLSQRQLARASGVANASISLIENPGSEPCELISACSPPTF